MVIKRKRAELTFYIDKGGILHKQRAIWLCLWHQMENCGFPI